MSIINSWNCNAEKRRMRWGTTKLDESRHQSLVEHFLTRINLYHYTKYSCGTPRQELLSTSGARYESSRFRFREQCSYHPRGAFACYLWYKCSEFFEYFPLALSIISRFQVLNYILEIFKQNMSQTKQFSLTFFLKNII